MIALLYNEKTFGRSHCVYGPFINDVTWIWPKLTPLPRCHSKTLFYLHLFTKHHLCLPRLSLFVWRHLWTISYVHVYFNRPVFNLILKTIIFSRFNENLIDMLRWSNVTAFYLGVCETGSMYIQSYLDMCMHVLALNSL